MFSAVIRRLRSRPSRAHRSPGSTNRRGRRPRMRPRETLPAVHLSPRRRCSRSRGSGGHSRCRSVAGQHLDAHPRVHVDPGDVAVVVLEHRVIRHTAPTVAGTMSARSSTHIRWARSGSDGSGWRFDHCAAVICRRFRARGISIWARKRPLRVGQRAVVALSRRASTECLRPYAK